MIGGRESRGLGAQGDEAGLSYHNGCLLLVYILRQQEKEEDT